MPERALTALEMQALKELGERDDTWVSSSVVAGTLKKSLLVDGVLNALMTLVLRELAVQHTNQAWKFQITESGRAELARLREAQMV